MTNEEKEKHSSFEDTEENEVKREYRAEVLFYIYFSLALFFIIYGIWQWYDLSQIEQGLKEGGLSIVLYKLYEICGKWGVSGLYVIIGIALVFFAIKKRKAIPHERDEDTDSDIKET